MKRHTHSSTFSPLNAHLAACSLSLYCHVESAIFTSHTFTYTHVYTCRQHTISSLFLLSHLHLFSLHMDIHRQCHTFSHFSLSSICPWWRSLVSLFLMVGLTVLGGRGLRLASGWAVLSPLLWFRDSPLRGCRVPSSLPTWPPMATLPLPTWWCTPILEEVGQSLSL